VFFNRPWPFIFIGWRGLAPQENPFANLSGHRLDQSTWRVQILEKSYLPRPDSELDVLHMNLDLLDKTYLTVMLKLPFEKLDHTGLTDPSRPA
jgi:hypothetical protein